MSRTAVAGLAVLAAVNAVLVPLALRANNGPAGTPAPAEPDRATVAPTPSTVDGADPGADAVWDDAGAVLDATAGLAVLAPAGGCGGAPAPLRLSRDGGHTWQPVNSPSGSVLRLRLESAQKLWLVGTDATCQPRMYRSGDAGATWQAQRSTDGAWYRLPDPAAKQLHAPDGLVAGPCGGDRRVTDVSALSASIAAVRCQGGSVQQTGDGGRTWQAVRVPDVRAFAFAQPHTLYVAEAGSTDCPGLRIARRPATAWERAGCVADAALDQPVALAFADARDGVLVAGTATYATTDGGATWQRRDTPPPPAVPPPHPRPVRYS